MDFKNSSKWEQVRESTQLNSRVSESAHAKVQDTRIFNKVFLLFFPFFFFKKNPLGEMCTILANKRRGCYDIQ